MTLEEFVGKTKLAGRTLETHETSGYSFRGTIRRIESWGILIRILLKNLSRRYERERGSTWRNVPDFDIAVGKNTPVERLEDGSVSFALPGGGGRACIMAGAKQNGAKS